MKKFFLLLISLSICCLICGCSLSNIRNVEVPAFPTNTPVPETSAEVTEEPVTEPVIVESGSIPVIITNIADTTTEHYDPENGTELILTFTDSVPSVYIEDKTDITDTVNETLGLIDEMYYTGEDYGIGPVIGYGYNLMVQLSEDNYSYVRNSGDSSMPLLYESSRQASVLRADNQCLSVLYSDYVYSGAEGQDFRTVFEFNMQNGELLSAEDVFDTAKLTDFLSEKIDGFDKSAFDAAISGNRWGLTEEGLVIYSDSCEEYTFAYNELKDIIKQEMLPVRESADTDIRICSLSDYAEGEYSVIDRIQISADESAGEFLIEFTGTAYNVSVNRVEYSDTFYDAAQLWNCSVIDNASLQLSMVIPDGIPNTGISYYTGDGIKHTVYISESGENGLPILIDGKIEAIG